MQERISVIVPVYNVEKYLFKCVRSICEQTYEQLEIILVDDGSTDESGRVCDELAGQDRRIKVIHKENAGVSGARNSGIDSATGEYILFCDSDDYISDQTMVQKLMDIMHQHQYALISFGYQRENLNGKKERTEFSECERHFDRLHDVTEFIINNFIEYRIAWETWTKMYRRKIITEHHLRFEDTSKVLAEDVCFELNYLYYCKSIYESSLTPYCYVRRDGSLTLGILKTSPAAYVNLINCVYGNLEENKVPISQEDMTILFTVWLNREISLFEKKGRGYKINSPVCLTGKAEELYSAMKLKDCIKNWGLKHGFVKYVRVKRFFHR